MPSQIPQSPKRTPVFNIPPATLWTIMVLVGMFLILRLSPTDIRDKILFYLAFDNLSFEEALAQNGLLLSTWLPLLTHGFLHVDFLHLLLNTGLLAAFGAMVERAFGKRYFFLIFAITIMSGALAQSWASTGQELVMIGASGGVYGLIGAAIPFIFWSHSGFRWRSSIGFIVALMMINLIIGPLSSAFDLFGARIAWQAHIGGFVIGLMLGILILLRIISQISRNS
ncbi:MAG: rhomboid family intramembrane serine protease [Kiloniellales bacterium]|nr:rhomboid family intramembrane serine protease [Kiloniellales bacterium]